MTRSLNLTMRRYSVQPRDWIFVKGYGFLSFARNMGRNIGRNITKNLNSKYSQKLLYNVKQSATDALKTALIRAIQKTAEAIDHLICNKIADRITKFQKLYQRRIQKQMKEKYFSMALRCIFFFKKNINKKHLCSHDKNYYCFCKSNISVINLIAGSRNMIKLSKDMSF